ncbi:MAG: peptidoglycan DD-metalloendopeptidase family protein [bacterium]
MKNKKLVMLIIFLILQFSFFKVFSNNSSDDLKKNNMEKELKTQKEEILKQKKIIQKLRQEETTTKKIFETKKKIENKIESNLKKYSIEIKKTKKEIEKINIKIDEQTQGIIFLENILNKHIIKISKQRKEKEEPILISYQKTIDSMRLQKFNKLIVKENIFSLNNFVEQKKIYDFQKTEKEITKNKTTKLESQYSVKNQDIKKQKKILNEQLIVFKKEKEKIGNVIKKSEIEISKLEKLLSNLRKKREPVFSEKSYFGRHQGKLAWPVLGEIINTGNSYVDYKGIFIDSQSEKNVCCICEGEIIFAESFKGYGNLIIIDHGNGYYSLYGYVSKILVKVGQKISKKQIIANTGIIPQIKKNGLYFEIRKDGISIPFSEWLEKK